MLSIKYERILAFHYQQKMSSSTQLIEDAVEAARRAVQFDTTGQLEPAIYFYRIAAKCLDQAATLSEPENATSLKAKSLEYSERAATVLKLKNTQQLLIQEDLQKQQRRRCHFLLLQALDADSSGQKDTAIERYANTIEYVTQNPELLHGELKHIIIQALERAEELKGIKRETPTNSAPSTPDIQPSAPPVSPIFVRRLPTLHRGQSAHLKVS